MGIATPRLSFIALGIRSRKSINKGLPPFGGRSFCFVVRRARVALASALAPHEKGPRSVVGACPSAGPLPGDLPASGRGLVAFLHEHSDTENAIEKAAGRDCLPRLRLSQVHYTMCEI